MASNGNRGSGGRSNGGRGSSGGRSGSAGGGRAASNEIYLNAGPGETRMAVVEQGNFSELHIERDRDRNVAGMVALGRVTRVLPGMQAAFVDIGLEKAAFLYVGDYLDADGQLDGEEDDPRPRRGRRGQKPPPRIDSLLHEGQEIVVQVAKEPIGTKGARITSHISVAGRHLVLTPWSKRVGVSRRIGSDRERRRLRDIVKKARSGELGFIIRTAGEGTRDADLEADVRYLAAVWDEIRDAQLNAKAPATLYEELSLPLRAIRDYANARTKRIVVDDPGTHEKMERFLSRFVADPKPKLERYQGELPLFDHAGLENRIDENLGRKVWLKSGGYLIVDQSEALTAIDVNTGRYVGRRDLEETVLKTNLEAVQEVVQQLRFRNLGGLIIIDLIDMESAENREKVHRALREALREDKARTNILKISELGLVEMTRKRTRENLVQQLCEPCGYCDGRGYVLSAESVAFKLLREIRKDLPRFSGRQIAVSVNPQVGEMLEGPARRAMLALGEEHGRELEVRTKPGMHQEQFELEALDSGTPLKLAVPWLETRAERAAAEKAAAEAKAAEELRVARERQEAEAAEAARRAEREQERERQRAEAREAEAAEAASRAEATAGEAEPAAADGDGAEPAPVDGAEAPEGTSAPPAAPIAAAASPEAEPKPAWDDDDDEPSPRPAAEAVDDPAEDPILPRFDKLEES